MSNKTIVVECDDTAKLNEEIATRERDGWAVNVISSRSAVFTHPASHRGGKTRLIPTDLYRADEVKRQIARKLKDSAARGMKVAIGESDDQTVYVQLNAMQSYEKEGHDMWRDLEREGYPKHTELVYEPFYDKPGRPKAHVTANVDSYSFEHGATVLVLNNGELPAELKEFL